MYYLCAYYRNTLDVRWNYEDSTETQYSFALNARTGAFTQFEDFEFNSFGIDDNYLLLASDNGLYKYTGTDDGSCPRTSSFIFEIDFQGFVKVKSIMFAGKSDKQLLCTTWFDRDTATKHSFLVDLVGSRAMEVKESQHTAFSTRWGRYLTVQIEDLNGADWELYSMDAYVIYRAHRQNA